MTGNPVDTTCTGKRLVMAALVMPRARAMANNASRFLNYIQKLRPRLRRDHPFDHAVMRVDIDEQPQITFLEHLCDRLPVARGIQCTQHEKSPDDGVAGEGISCVGVKMRILTTAA